MTVESISSIHPTACAGTRRGIAAVGSVRRLAGNFLVLSAGELAAKLATFATFAYLGRVLGPKHYGSLEFVLATMILFTLPVDFGLGVYGAREIAKGHRHASALIRDISTLRLLSACVTLSLLLGFLLVLPREAEVRLLLLLYGLSLLGMPALLQWVFQGCDAMHWVAAASIVRQGTFAVLVFPLVRPGTPIYMVGMIECAAVTVVAAVCMTILRQRLHLSLPRFHFRWRRLALRWRTAAPIGLSELAWAVLWYFPTVQLGFLAPDEAIGRFGAAHRIVMALHTFVWLYFFNLLPTMSRCASMPKRHLGDLMSHSIVAVAWGTILVAFAIGLVSEPLFVLVFGPSFSGGGLLLALLIWLIPIAMLSGHYRYSLIACNLQSLEFLCTAISAVVSITLGFLLIPVLGALGAAVGLLAANLVNFGVAAGCVRSRIVKIRFLPQVVEPLAAMGAGLGAFFVLVNYF